MARRTREERRLIDRSCPPDLRREVYLALMAGISGQGIKAGERLPDLVARVCPTVVAFTRAQGFSVELDLPENTHVALCQGHVAVEIRRLPAR